VKTLSSVVLALLGLLAFSQIRSRRLIEQIRRSHQAGLAIVAPARLVLADS
jgi:hypothetical protein